MHARNTDVLRWAETPIREDSVSEPIPEELIAALDDGTVLLFRPLLPEDKERLRAGFERLSPESRYRRFFRHLDHLTDEQLRYLTEIDYVRHFAWVALLRDEPGQPGVGVARWVRADDDPQIAEAAVTVIDEYHGRGIGSTLLRLAAASAIERGVRAFRAWTLGDNKPMLELLKHLGARPGRWDSGVLELIAPLPTTVEDLAASPAPLILKAVADGRLVGEADPGDVDRTTFVARRRTREKTDDGDGAPDRT